jgi:hypothetical protein
LAGGNSRIAVAGVILLGYVASLAVNFPGHFPPDALWQLAQGRAGRYNTWHPPIMAWLLGLADRLHPGAWLFVLLTAALFYGGLFALVALERRPRPVSLLLIALWMVSPVVLIYQGVVLKDVLFANAALAGFAALAWAGRLWDSVLRRSALLAASLLLLTLAALARQNGFIPPLFAASALAAIVLDRPAPSKRARIVRAGVWASVALALVAGGDVLATRALEAHADGRPENANHLKVLQVYDLAGAVRLDPALSLPILRESRPALERFLRDQAALHYRAAGADNLFALPDGAEMMIPPGAAAGQQWIGLIRSHPWLYLRTRTRVWWTTLTTPLSAGCPMIITGIDGGDPNVLAAAGLSARQNAKDEWDEDFASRFLGGPLYSHVFYGALLVVALTGLAVRWPRLGRDPARIVTAAMGLAALAFTASFFVVSIDCDYRFLYFLDIAAMACLTRLVASRPSSAGH